MWRRVTNTTARCPEKGQRVVDDGYTFERKNSALATVMLVAEDMLALHILPMLDAGLFSCIHVAVRSRPASARFTRAWPRSSRDASLLVSWPDWTPCSIRFC